MAEGTIPPHWKELVEHSRELATDEDLNLTTFWANMEMDQELTSFDKEEMQQQPWHNWWVSFAANLLAETITPSNV